MDTYQQGDASDKGLICLTILVRLHHLPAFSRATLHAYMMLSAWSISLSSRSPRWHA